MRALFRAPGTFSPVRAANVVVGGFAVTDIVHRDENHTIALLDRDSRRRPVAAGQGLEEAGQRRTMEVRIARGGVA